MCIYVCAWCGIYTYIYVCVVCTYFSVCVCVCVYRSEDNMQKLVLSYYVGTDLQTQVVV